MRMPERMPRNPWLFDPVTCRCQFTVVEILRTQWRSLRCREDQVVRLTRNPAGAMGLKHLLESRTDRYYAMTAARFWRAEFTVGRRFGDFERSSQQVNAFPPKGENLPYS